MAEKVSIHQMGELAAKNPENANYIVDLLELLQAEDEGTVLQSCDALLVCFKLLFKETPEWFCHPFPKWGPGSSLEHYGAWVHRIYQECHKGLTLLMSHSSNSVRVKVMEVMMDLIGLHASPSPFPNQIFLNLIENLYKQEESIVIEAFIDKYLCYYDMLYYVLKNTVKLVPVKLSHLRSGKLKGDLFVRNVYSVLNGIRLKMRARWNNEEMSYLTHNTSSTEDNQVAGSLADEGSDEVDHVSHLSEDVTPPAKRKKKKQRKKVQVSDIRLTDLKKSYGDAWLTFLQLPLTSRMLKEVLVFLHNDVMPHMADPRRLIDFLTSCSNAGGVVSILALNGLFVLVHKYHLDYPDFYNRLYALLEPRVLSEKYMERFMYLLDMFLLSTHLPHYLVSAFIKKLSRMALSAPPHGSVVVIVMVSNLMKRHPKCKAMLHNNGMTTSAKQDVFLSEEPDPKKCKATESFLWEIETLKVHYVPKVANLAKTLFKLDQLNKPEHSLGEHLDWSYEEELGQTISAKKNVEEVPINFKPQEGLFLLEDGNVFMK